jgi:RNA polymerase sigma factor for flagellar operon FliA
VPPGTSTIQLLDRCLPYVRRLARRVHRQLGAPCEVEELVAWGQVGLLEACQRFDPDQGASFLTFAHYRIQGAILDGLRAMCRGGHAAGEAHPVDDQQPPVDERLHLQRLGRRLRAELVRLPERERRLLLGHYYRGQTLAQVGARLGRSKSWSSRLHARALRRLRHLLQEEPR